jgi:carboxymethylenebutenolidase
MIRSLNIPSADGTIDGKIFTPEGATGPLPAVIMFTDIGGLRSFFDEKAQTVADAGYAVLLPNVYYRSGPGQIVPEGVAFHEVMPLLGSCARLLTAKALAADFAALIGAIDAAPEFADGMIGAVGYCMSGSFVIRLAALHPDRVAAVAGFHAARLAAEGDPHSAASLAPQIRARVYFGHADRDEYLPPEEIGRMDAALAAAGVHFTTEFYAGKLHSFTTKDASAYDADADALHFKRLLALFEETLVPA